MGAGSALFRETGMSFLGPVALALRARMQGNMGERERDRAEAEALLEHGWRATTTSGTTASAWEANLPAANGGWSLLHAAALELTAAEPLPYSPIS